MTRIRRGRYNSWRDRVSVALAKLAGVLDCLVVVLSLTYFVSDFRAAVLFSDRLNDWVDGGR